MLCLGPFIAVDCYEFKNESPAIRPRHLHHRLESLNTFSDRALYILLCEGFWGCAEYGDLADSGGEGCLHTFGVWDEDGVGDAGDRADTSQNLRVIRKLRNSFRWNKGGGLHHSETCIRKAVDQIDFGFRGYVHFLVLETVARADLHDFYGTQFFVDGGVSQIGIPLKNSLYLLHNLHFLFFI